MARLPKKFRVSRKAIRKRIASLAGASDELRQAETELHGIATSRSLSGYEFPRIIAAAKRVTAREKAVRYAIGRFGVAREIRRQLDAQAIRRLSR